MIRGEGHHHSKCGLSVLLNVWSYFVFAYYPPPHNSFSDALYA